MASTPQRPATYRSVVAVPEFRRLWAAHLLSIAGDQLARVALTVLVFDRTRSAGLAALTYALTYLPDLIGGAALAHVADRFSRRGVLVVTDLARAALVAAMAIPALPLWVRIVLLAAVQLAAAPFQAARTAVLPDILDSDRLTVGIGIMQTTYQVGLAAGFGAGAAVVGTLGPAGALLVDAATFVLSAAVIGTGLGAHRPPTTTARGPGRWATVTNGWRVVIADRRLRALLAIACCSGFYVVPEGLAVPYAAQLGAGTAAVGWLLAANPVGTVLGLTVLRAVAPERRLRRLGLLVVATSAVLLPTGWEPALPISVVLWTVSGALSAHDMVTNAAYVAAAPQKHRGQAIGLAIAALRASQGVAIVATGLLAQLWGPAAVITLAAAGGVGGGVAAAVMWRRASRDDVAEDFPGR
ncbi:MFS transporter [Amycolatopsis sp. OK19-0408]|uniref:MFS transporter n=1 Tax=Amycolatopsis iheyensis TaxID=2945988 RepID=A0A9X2NKK9_9PSEU|nr:MFS transporter [Amycolatopsis iheyensis]MCR6490546.1 MFS transporter [Amycolatopsis iheyensis]